MARKQINGGTGRSEERRVSIEIEIPLEDNEYRKEADLLATETLAILTLKEEKKAFDAKMNEKIKAIEETRDPRATVVKQMKKKAMVDCIETADFDRNTIVVRNAKTKSAYDELERTMTPEERDRMAQGQLPWPDQKDVVLPEKDSNDIEAPPPAKRNGAAEQPEA